TTRLRRGSRTAGPYSFRRRGQADLPRPSTSPPVARPGMRSDPQPLRGLAPSLARVPRLPDGHLSLVEHAIHGADERGNEGRALPVRMGRNRESEVRRQAFGDLRPRTPVRPTVVRASVVLLEERTVAG